MNIGVVGVNHNLASIKIREEVSFTDIKKVEVIDHLLDLNIDEVIILSTCNRSEIYIHGADIKNKIKLVKEFYKNYFHVEDIEKYLFTKINESAISHLFNVTSGLDSIVIGEDQILGQVKDAHEFSMKVGSSKKVFNKLFRQAITTAKEIKCTTKISQQPLSISYIAIKFLKSKLDKLHDKNVLVIGTGKMSRLTITHLLEENVGKIYLANRNYDKTIKLKEQNSKIIPIDYDERYKILQNVDIVVSATSSPHLILKYEEVKDTKNIIMMDLALPRDIDSKLDENKKIDVYDIDDLKTIQNESDVKRKGLAKVASKMIQEDISLFIEWFDCATIDPTIKSLNDRCVEIREDTLEYLFKKLELNGKERQLIDKMMTSALKRLIREPIINLKQVKDKGKREEYIKSIEELFNI